MKPADSPASGSSDDPGCGPSRPPAGCLGADPALAGGLDAASALPGRPLQRQSLLGAILQPSGLRVVFQPIFEVDGPDPELHAYESLARGPVGTAAESPDVLFDYVRRKGEEAVVDRACIAKALHAAAVLPAHVKVSVNVHASSLGRDAGLVPFLAGHLEAIGMAPQRLIVEVVEFDTPWGRPAFLEATGRLRAMGIHLAIDDIGNGQSNYRMLLDVRPDYFKIDRYFVRGALSDPFRAAILDSIAALAGKFGAQVVAEGVEDVADLEAVRRAGIRLVQGHLFAMAAPVEDFLAPGAAGRPPGGSAALTEGQAEN